MVDTYLTRSHHHTTSDSVQWVRADTSTSGHSPTKSEGGREVTLKRTNEQDGLEGVVHAEVKTTVDDDTSDGRTETTVETSDTIGGKGLTVDIDQAVELAVTTYDVLGSCCEFRKRIARKRNSPLVADLASLARRVRA